MAEFFSGVSFFSNFIHLLILILGGYFIYQGTMKTGELMGFLLYVSMFLQPLRKLTILMENYQKGMAGFHRFLETLELQPEILDEPDAEDVPMVDGRITFQDVTFSYNNKENIPKNISFIIEPGETVAIVGPSGGGKTTLCNLIPKFYEIEKVIQESLYQLSDNRTSLIIAHRLATIKNADRIMVLTDEGIVEEGSHEDLLRKNGIYKRLYQAQFDGLNSVVA